MTGSTTRGYPYYQPADPADIPAATQALAAAVDSDVTACVNKYGLTSWGDVDVAAASEWTSISFPSANMVFAAKVRATRVITPTAMEIYITTAGANVDMAITDSTGAHLWSSGSYYVSSTGTFFMLVTGVTLNPGEDYYLALACDSTSLALYGKAVVWPFQGKCSDSSALFNDKASSMPIPNPLTGMSASDYTPLILLLE